MLNKTTLLISLQYLFHINWAYLTRLLHTARVCANVSFLQIKSEAVTNFSCYKLNTISYLLYIKTTGNLSRKCEYSLKTGCHPGFFRIVFTRSGRRFIVNKNCLLAIVSATAAPHIHLRRKKPREPNTCATIESIVRHVQAEPTGEDVRLRTKRLQEPWAVTRFGVAKYTPELFLVIGSVSVTLKRRESAPGL